MKITVEIRAKRNIKDIPHLKLATGEYEGLGKLVAILDNSPYNDHLLICEKGVQWNNGKIIEKIKYIEIDSIDFLVNNKYTDFLLVHMNDGSSKHMPVRGKWGPNNKFSAACSMLSFFWNVVRDAKKEN